MDPWTPHIGLSETEKDNSTSIIHTQSKPFRKHHKRSKTGCPQCRKRRVKCDESLPSCFKCLDKSIKCGYLDYSKAEIEEIERANGKTDDGYLIPFINHFNFEKELQKDYNYLTKDISINLIPFRSLIPIFLKLISTEVSMFDAFLLLAYSSLLLKVKHQKYLLPNFLSVQNICIQHILNNLNDLNDNNLIPILSVSIALDISSKSHKDGTHIGFNITDSNSKFSNGPISIIETVYKDPLKFPKSLPILKEYRDELFKLQNRP